MVNHWSVFPDKKITSGTLVSDHFLNLGIDRFLEACRYVHKLPYGYNTNRDDMLTLFKEKMGSCTTKHAVIATLAHELVLPIKKSIAIYAMTEDLVTGTDPILQKYDLPYIPMIHCLLTCQNFNVDLTEGNRNGKTRRIQDFLFTQKVIPNISAKDEYLIYRKTLSEQIMKRQELKGNSIKQVLHAREEGLEILKKNIL